MKKLKIMCTGEIDVDFHSLLELQLTEDGRSLKATNNEKISKLALSMKKYGIVNNLQVWVNGDEIYCFDAHHRKKALAKLEAEGLEIPLLPATRCLAKTMEEAKKLLVLKESSNSWIDTKVIGDFLAEIDFDIGDAELVVEIPDFDWGAKSSGVNKNDPDALPTEAKTIVIKKGDLIILGDHRILCGDSTEDPDVERLMNGEKGLLLHADPPYGMGKKKDGVENDNIYREKLDEFQMDWWTTFRPHIIDNASVYIWGNSPDLWRLWYRRLESTEYFEMRNEIVWDKKTIPGMKSDLLTQYPVVTEHCLFFQIGHQFLGNINSEDFPEEYEPLRSYLAGEADLAGIKPKDIKEHCDCQMYAHWFTRSQFTLISNKHYKILQGVYPGRFSRPWSDLKLEWDTIKGFGRNVINQRHARVRSYFDNAHDIMSDVWEFPRVVGEERWEHATPKPVDMISRAIKSSSPPEALVVEPFCGSGSTMIAAEKIGRRCFSMELLPVHVQASVQRWCDYTETDIIELNGIKISWSALNE